MDPRTHHQRRYAGATWNAGLNNWHTTQAPNAFFVTRDLFPSQPTPPNTRSYRPSKVPLPVTTGYTSYAQASSSKATPLRQPHLLARFSQRFEASKPKTQKRVHFAEIGTPEPSKLDLLPLFTSLYAFFVAATFIILGSLAHCIVGALSFTLQVIYAQYASLSEAWRTSWQPWLENRWTSWRLGFEVRPLPKIDASVSLHQHPNEFWAHRISAKHHTSQYPTVSLPERSMRQELKTTFARNINLVKRCSTATFSWCLHTASRLLSLLVLAAIRIPSLLLAIATKLILSLAYAIAQTPFLISAVVCKSSSSLYQTTLSVTERLYDVWLDIKEWWDPLPMRPSIRPSTNPTSTLNRAPSPDRAKLARALGRRRRRITPEQSGSTSVATSSTSAPLPTNPTASASSSNAATSTQAPPIHRPKSLQHARQWRNLASSSSTATSLAPPPEPLPRIDLHLQVARHALSAFSKLRQFFVYPDAATPELQALMEDIYDSPVRIAVEGALVRAPSPDQPALVVHRMYWNGEEEQVPEVLSVALNTSLTKLVITHCHIALRDVIGLISTSFSLQTLEIRDIATDGKAITPFIAPSLGHGPSVSSGLSSLTITSFVRLDSLFERVQLLYLSSLSLRLHGDGNATTFHRLLASSFAPDIRAGGQVFRLRAQLAPERHALLEEALERSEVSFEYCRC